MYSHHFCRLHPISKCMLRLPNMFRSAGVDMASVYLNVSTLRNLIAHVYM